MKKIIFTLLVLLLAGNSSMQAQEVSTPADEARLAHYTRLLNGNGRTPDPVFARLSTHYQKRMDAFAEEHPITSDDIVMLGNSLTEGGGNWNERLGYQKRRIVNRGIVGDTASGILFRLGDILAQRPAQLFLLIGVNDLQVGRLPSELLKNIETIIARTLVESPQTQLVVQTLLPIDESTKRYKYLQGKSHLIKEINDGICTLAEEYGVELVDLFPCFLDPSTQALPKSLSNDGLHLNAEGYQIWAGRIKPLLLE